MVKYVDPNKVSLSGIQLLGFLIGVAIVIKLATDNLKLAPRRFFARFSSRKSAK
jgi:hypothetical protein